MVHCQILGVFCSGHILYNSENDVLTKSAYQYSLFPKNFCSATYLLLLSLVSVVCSVCDINVILNDFVIPWIEE